LNAKPPQHGFEFVAHVLRFRSFRASPAPSKLPKFVAVGLAGASGAPPNVLRGRSEKLEATAAYLLIDELRVRRSARRSGLSPSPIYGFFTNVAV
jgi:hypothetical protein